MTTEDLVHGRTIHRVLKNKVHQYGDREFFYYKGKGFSYQDLEKASDKVAKGLQSQGIKKGDKVGVVMKNRPEFLFIWFGLCKLGAIEVPINTAHRGSILTYMIDHADCRLLIVEAPFLDRVAPVLKDLPTVEKVVVLNDTDEPTPALDKSALDYGLLVENDGSYREEEVLSSDPFIIMFTSGTTGPSKGSLMPHNYALYMGELSIEATGYDENDCLYNALPLFHGNAQLLPPCLR